MPLASPQEVVQPRYGRSGVDFIVHTIDLQHYKQFASLASL